MNSAKRFFFLSGLLAVIGLVLTQTSQLVLKIIGWPLFVIFVWVGWLAWKQMRAIRRMGHVLKGRPDLQQLSGAIRGGDTGGIARWAWRHYSQLYKMYPNMTESEIAAELFRARYEWAASGPMPPSADEQAKIGRILDEGMLPKDLLETCLAIVEVEMDVSAGGDPELYEVTRYSLLEELTSLGYRYSS